MSKNEPCPFCGGRPRFFEYKRTNTEIIMMVECVDCGCTPFSLAMSIVWGEEYARKAIAEKWNTRDKRYSCRWENETDKR